MNKEDSKYIKIGLYIAMVTIILGIAIGTLIITLS